MATILDLDPQEGDVIKGASGNPMPVCVVDGELFWNGQFLSAYGGDCFSIVSHTKVTTSEEDIRQRKLDIESAIKRRKLDEKYM